jgi:hypothetical protein
MHICVNPSILTDIRIGRNEYGRVTIENWGLDQLCNKRIMHFEHGGLQFKGCKRRRSGIVDQPKHGNKDGTDQGPG